MLGSMVGPSVFLRELMISSGVPATAKSQFTRTTFVFVPVEFLFLRQNTMTKKHVRREGSNQLTYLHCCSSLEEVRTGTQAGLEAGGRSRCKGRSWCRGHGRMLLIGLLHVAYSRLLEGTPEKQARWEWGKLFKMLWDILSLWIGGG